MKLVVVGGGCFYCKYSSSSCLVWEVAARLVATIESDAAPITMNVNLNAIHFQCTPNIHYQLVLYKQQIKIDNTFSSIDIHTYKVYHHWTSGAL